MNEKRETVKTWIMSFLNPLKIFCPTVYVISRRINRMIEKILQKEKNIFYKKKLFNELCL